VQASAFCHTVVIDNTREQFIFAITIVYRCHVCIILLKFTSFTLSWAWFLSITLCHLPLFNCSLFDCHTPKNIRSHIFTNLYIFFSRGHNIEFRLFLSGTYSTFPLTFFHQLILNLLNDILFYRNTLIMVIFTVFPKIIF
jgi:hypothetical protein